MEMESNRPIRDPKGKLLASTEELAAAWAEHFKTLLNQPQLTNRCVIQPAATDLDISCEKPSKAEIRKAIGALNAGKAAGPDSIPPEALKGSIEESTDLLYILFEKSGKRKMSPETGRKVI